MGVLDGGGDRRRERAVFLLGGEFEASHCNQWGLRSSSLHSFARATRSSQMTLGEDLF